MKFLQFWHFILLTINNEIIALTKSHKFNIDKFFFYKFSTQEKNSWLIITPSQILVKRFSANA